jgi:ABC-type nitrate/sulfonate/bicarbonate transport system ATPase subunit
MAVKPKALLLDEPFSALDEDLRERLALETLSALRSEGIAVVYVTHSRAEANAVADRVVNFQDLGVSS